MLVVKSKYNTKPKNELNSALKLVRSSHADPYHKYV